MGSHLCSFFANILSLATRNIDPFQISQDYFHRLDVVKFPRDAIDIAYEDAKKEIMDLLPEAPDKLYIFITVKLEADAKVRLRVRLTRSQCRWAPDGEVDVANDLGQFPYESASKPL